MNIYEHDKYPYLEEEKKLIAACMRENRKVLGICLGAQLIAHELGQKVYPNTTREIGWYPVRGGGNLIPESFLPFHWHGETFNLPEGAIHLASSNICRNQAFSLGTNVLALQFHLEANSSLIEGLIKNVPKDLTPGSWVQSEEEIRKGLMNVERNKEILYALLETFTMV